MATASLRSEGRPLGRISEATAEHKQRLRIAVPERAEVVAVHGDDDWFELFSDEKDLAPRTGRRREPVGSQPIDRDPIRVVTRAAALAAPPPAPAPMTPETPAWLSRVFLHWRFSNWPVIAGVAGTVLSTGVLVLVAGSLRGGAPVPADIRLSSASNEPSWTSVSQPEVAVIPVVANVSRTPIPAPTPAPRTPALSRAARPVLTTKQSTRDDSPSASSSARPTSKSTPTPVPSLALTPTPSPSPMLTPTPTPAPAATPPRIDAAPGVVSAPPPSPAPPSNAAMVRSVLDQYRRAYGSLDANAVAEVWPSVNVRSLARAFAQLDSQRFEFTDCRIDLSAARAQATCTGNASFVPKIGGRATRTENREWAFLLERLNDGWIISRAESR
jgi:hypothetical protein